MRKLTSGNLPADAMGLFNSLSKAEIMAAYRDLWLDFEEFLKASSPELEMDEEDWRADLAHRRNHLVAAVEAEEKAARNA